MSHASPYAVLPEDVTQKVVDYGLGFLCSWSPQQMVLGHEASASYLMSSPFPDMVFGAEGNWLVCNSRRPQ